MGGTCFIQVYTPRACNLLTANAQSPHRLRTIRTPCMLHLHATSPQAAHHLHTIYTQSTHHLQTIHIQSTGNPHTIHTQFTPTIYTQSAHTVHTGYSSPGSCACKTAPQLRVAAVDRSRAAEGRDGRQRAYRRCCTAVYCTKLYCTIVHYCTVCVMHYCTVYALLYYFNVWLCQTSVYCTVQHYTAL